MSSETAANNQPKIQKTFRELVAIRHRSNRIAACIGGLLVGGGVVVGVYGIAQAAPTMRAMEHDKEFCGFGYTNSCEQIANEQIDLASADEIVGDGFALGGLGLAVIGAAYFRDKQDIGAAACKLPLEEQVTLLAYGAIPQAKGVPNEQKFR